MYVRIVSMCGDVRQRTSTSVDVRRVNGPLDPVYTIQPVAKQVDQPVASCKLGLNITAMTCCV